jgi:hypothetical protein
MGDPGAAYISTRGCILDEAESILAGDPPPEKIEQIVREIESLALRFVKRDAEDRQ